MKTKTILLLITTLTILNRNAFAQGFGVVYFGNTSTNRVFLSDGTTPVPRQADGGTYVAELLSALDGADFSTAVRQGLPTTFNTPQAGVFLALNGVLTVPTTINGGFGQFRVRVWDTRGGATYEDALANFDPRLRDQLGQSPIFRTDTADPTQVPLPTPAALRMPSFHLSPDGSASVPEPSTYALFLLGAGALWFFRRRK